MVILIVTIYGAPATEAFEVPVVLGPGTPPSHENLLEMQNSRPTESETLKVGSCNLINKPSKWFW